MAVLVVIWVALVSVIIAVALRVGVHVLLLSILGFETAGLSCRRNGIWELDGAARSTEGTLNQSMSHGGRVELARREVREIYISGLLQ